MSSIKGKIVFFVVVVMVILPVLFTLYFTREHYAQGERVAENVDEMFQILNTTIVRDIRHAMLAKQIRGIRESLLSMKSYKQIRSTTLLDSEGKVVMKDGGVFIQRGSRKKPSDLQARVVQEVFNTSKIQLDIQRNHSVFFYRYLVPFKNERECQRCHGHFKKINGVLVLNFQVPDVRGQTRRLTFITFGFSLAGIVFTSLLLLFLIQQIVVSPLREIQDAMQHVAGGDMAVQVLSRRDDEIGRVSHYFNDMVKKLKRSQESLEKSIQEREKARFLSDIGMMASRVAHEVRNPLNVLEGAAYYLKGAYGSQKDIVEHVSLIQKNVKRLERFSEDLLSFAKPEELHKTGRDVNAHLMEKAQEFIKLRNKKKINVRFELSQGLPKIPMDSFKMDAVFENILQNAYDAVPDGGEIMISTHAISSFVYISIRDNGCGIPERQKENLFQPFFTTKPGGTGLGLSIARKIIESHGGEISISSIENKGTEVRIQLPGGAA